MPPLLALGHVCKVRCHTCQRTLRTVVESWAAAAPTVRPYVEPLRSYFRCSGESVGNTFPIMTTRTCNPQGRHNWDEVLIAYMEAHKESVHYNRSTLIAKGQSLQYKVPAILPKDQCSTLWPPAEVMR
jgi:hypothetical protein